MTAYRERILSILRREIEAVHSRRALDFGCGDGWFAKHLSETAVTNQIVALEVKKRPNCLVEPLLYDGEVIPFGDQEFDLVYAMDVLHHCREPLASLREMMRCTSRYLVIKDHNFQTPLGWLALCILDELGNRRFDILSRYHYQRRWSWVDMIEANGFRRVQLLSPVGVHIGILGALTNQLQFIGIWERPA